MDTIINWLELGSASVLFAVWYFPYSCMLLAFAVLCALSARNREKEPAPKFSHDEGVARLVEFMTRKRP